MAENEGFVHGAVTFPLAAQNGRSSLQDADPAVFYALDFARFMLEKYIGDRFREEANAAELKLADGIVGTVVPYDPSGYLGSVQFRFPILGLYRRTEKFADKTLGFRSGAANAEMCFILPPLTAGQAEAMLPLLNAVKAVIDRTVEQGKDPGYTPPGGTLGDSVWGKAYARLDSFDLTDVTFGAYPGAQGDMTFPAALFGLDLKELGGDDVTGYPAFEGADIDTQLDPGERGGPLFDELANDLVNFDLSLASLTPLIGAVAGNTTLSLTGTGFTPDVHVIIGGKLAKNVVVTGTTMITCKTPPYDALATSVDVTVTNRNNQSATLEDGFTYV